MLIKFFINDELADKVRHLTGINVGSRAFRRAAELSIEYHNTVRELEDEVRRLQAIAESQQQILIMSRNAARLLLEQTAQADLVIEANKVHG